MKHEAIASSSHSRANTFKGEGAEVSTIRSRGSGGPAREYLGRYTHCLRSRVLAASIELGPLGDAVRGGRLRGVDTGVA